MSNLYSIDNNTTAKNPTYFLRGAELVDMAHEKYKLLSENWCYPTRYHFGFPTDKYYAEIWHDGMDWTNNYWLIEDACWNKPQIYPAIYFDNSDQREKYNEHDFEKLLITIMSYRRDMLWFNKHEHDRFDDFVWPYIRIVEPYQSLERCSCMIRYRVLHASQPRVEFYLNIDLIPPQQPVSNKVTTDNGVTIESEYPTEEKIND